jgi:tRNA-2-methylthio-N6-dimethylallyladenosine synthase
MLSSSSEVERENAVPETKKVFVKTFGCQMNVYDSERMAEALAPHGYAQTARMAEADVIVLNTCHIREKAAEKVYSELGRIHQVKRRRKAEGIDTVVAVAGCVAQAEGAEIVRRSPVVDLVVGPQAYHRLPALIIKARSPESRPVIDTEFPDEDKFGHLPKRMGPRQVTAFLTVQEGCDKFCTFCVVPYTRGAEFSRPVIEVAAEARRLVVRGVREITLLGQNVNAYHGQGPDGRPWSLARLIAHLAEFEGLERIRYTTSHPRDMDDALIAAHRDVGKLMPYLHLPIQSGADRILAAMNRKHTAKDYLRLVEKIRVARPDIALSTDIIVGFPGETEAEFQETLTLVRKVGFAQAYSFNYSARPGTPAATMDEQVPDAVKSDRLRRLQVLLDEQQASFNADCVGKLLPVLFEKPGRQPGQLVGRSPYLQAVHAPAADSLHGRILPVEIVAVGSNSLSGVVHSG